MSCWETIQNYGLRSLGYGERLLPRGEYTLCEHFTLIGSGRIWNVYFGALALTSRTAARLLAGRPQFHAIPTFCVGAASAREARAAGARDVVDAGGDVEDLADLLIRRARPLVVHLCGADQRGDLTGRLAAAGIAAERRIVYRMAAADALPPLADGLDATMLYSPRTAAIYRALATRPPWCEAACVALSPAVAADAPRGVPLAVAETPDEPALFAALDRLCAAGPPEGSLAP